MPKTITPPVLCTCTDKKRFNYPVQCEDAEDASAIYLYHFECPYSSYEKNCAKHLTIQLPPGEKPITNGEIFRGQ